MAFAALTIDINAKLANLEEGLSKTQKQLDDMARRADRASKQIDDSFAKIGKGVRDLGIAAAVTFVMDKAISEVQRLVGEMSALDDASEQVGSSVEQVSETFNKWKVSGGTLGELTGATGRLVRAMQGADDETKGAGEAFAALGIKTRDASGQLRDSMTVLEEVAKALNQYEDGTNKVAIAQAIFGKAGADLLPKLKDLANETATFGKVSAEQAAKAEELEKAIRRLQVASDIAKQSFLAELIPAVLKLIEQFNAGREAAGGFFAAMGKFGLSLPGDPAEKLRELREERERLTAQIQGEQSAIDGDQFFGRSARKRASENVERLKVAIADVQKQIGYYQVLERQQLDLESKTLDARDGQARGGKKPAAPSLSGGNKPASNLKEAKTEADRLLESLSQQLDKTQKLTEEQQVLGRIGRGAIEGMNPAIEQQILLLAVRIDKEKELRKTIEEATREEEEQYREQAKLNEAAKRDLDAFIQSTMDAVDPTRKLYDEMERVANLMKFGLIPDDIGQKRIDQLIAKAGEEIGKTVEKAAEADSAFRDLGLTMQSAFEDAIIEGKNLREVLQGLAKDIARIYLRMQFTKPLAEFIGGGNVSNATIFGQLLGAFSGYAGSTVTPNANVGADGYDPVLLTGKSAPAPVFNITTNVDSRTDAAQIKSIVNQSQAGTIAKIQESMRSGGWAAQGA